MRIVVDTTHLDGIKSRVIAEAVVQKMAQDTQAEIVMNFNTQSPSPAGEAPGVDTGNLKNSVVANPRGALTWVVGIGAEYGVNLEYGTSKMAARPFVRPAINRMMKNLPDDLLVKLLE